MLGPESMILDGRQAFRDAQAAYAGTVQPRGFFACGWYGSAVSDERGSFGLVEPTLGLADAVGDVVQVSYRGRTVNVYVIGSQAGLGTEIAITRRCYLAISVLSTEPIAVTVGTVSL